MIFAVQIKLYNNCNVVSEYNFLVQILSCKHFPKIFINEFNFLQKTQVFFSNVPDKFNVNMYCIYISRMSLIKSNKRNNKNASFVKFANCN